MQIVIDIPEGILNTIQADNMISREQLAVLQMHILNGTPLPKGHGDLKDANKLKHAFISGSMAVQGNFTDADIANIVCNSPTIIEADMTESEE